MRHRLGLVVAVPGTGGNLATLPGRVHGCFCKDSKLFAFETQSSDVLGVPEPEGLDWISETGSEKEKSRSVTCWLVASFPLIRPEKLNNLQ